MDTIVQWQSTFPDALVYEPCQSRVLTFGIDFTSPATSGAASSRSRNQQAEKDAMYIAGTVKDMMIGCSDQSNVQVYTVSNNEDKCTAAGIKKAFSEELKQVGEEGLFIFMFVGSAAAVSGSCSLNPVDFDATNVATHITDETIIKWLSQLPPGSSLPKHMVFVFNCPFATQLAGGMTNEMKYRLFGGNVSICSLGVTSGSDTSSGPIVDILDHSFFAFFFDRFLRNARFSQPGNFVLKQGFTKIGECCEALSSLVVTYRNGELKSNIMESVTGYLKRDQPTGRVETDSADVGRFEFLTKHVDRKKRRVTLHRMVDAFLECVGDYNTGALTTLHTNGVLANSDVFQTSFCVMMFSVASFQVAEKKEDIQNPSLFVEAFLRVAATIESFYKDPEADHAEFYVKIFRRAVDFYLQVLQENKVNTKKIQEYLHKVNAETARIA